MTTQNSHILLHAQQHPSDVNAQIQAAYHCDSQRTELEAITFYDAAWKLGIPPQQRSSFMLGYGSTLKNVGRLRESQSILQQALIENPNNLAIKAFLALTLHASKQHNQATQLLLQSLLSLKEHHQELQKYSKALAFYTQELHKPEPEHKSK